MKLILIRDSFGIDLLRLDDFSPDRDDSVLPVCVSHRLPADQSPPVPTGTTAMLTPIAA
jgi:hypothetical protein